jgi:hypothetical protein
VGLDITAYSHMQHRPDLKPDTDEEFEDAWNAGGVQAFWYEGFDESGSGLVQGDWYVATDQTDSLGFRAGSYGGYHRWRETLAGHVGLTLRDYWERSNAGQPFYELINFADNEGTIGPEAAANLLVDFRAQKASYEASHDTYNVEKYNDWITALELASQGGLVHFH